MNYHTKIYVGMIALALIFCFFILISPKAMAPNIVGGDYSNITVRTYVNITHSKPDVLNVTVYEAQNSSSYNVTVSAGARKKVICNATVRSWEGYNDIVRVNATLWNLAGSSYNATDNNNTHYTNATCTVNSSLGPFTGWYACYFDVWYYSNNGTWICTIAVANSYTVVNSNFTGYGNGTTNFYPVYALNVTDGINFGNVAVEDYSSPDRTANLTNLGNMPINISVEGYGVTRGDGLAMNCSLTGNITVDNERFATTSGQAFAAKNALNGTLGGSLIPGLRMPKQINSSLVQNSTYWQLYIPPNPAGNCSGNILFTAIAP